MDGRNSVTLRLQAEYLVANGFLDDTILTAGSIEHLIHEFCHVITLHDESLAGPDIEQNVSRRVSLLTGEQADWNEIKTIACEMVVLRDHSLVGFEFSSWDIVSNADFHMGREEADMHVQRLAESKVAGRRAKKVKDLILRTYEAAVEEDEEADYEP